MSRVELGSTIFAQKLSELHSVNVRFRDETVRHFFTIVRTSCGRVVRFDDAGSKAVKIRTSRYPQEEEQ